MGNCYVCSHFEYRVPTSAPSPCLRDGQRKAQRERVGTIVLWNSLVMVWAKSWFLDSWVRNYLQVSSRQWEKHTTLRGVPRPAKSVVIWFGLDWNTNELWKCKKICTLKKSIWSKHERDTGTHNALWKEEHSTDVYIICDFGIPKSTLLTIL